MTAEEVARQHERCDVIVAGRWYEYNYDPEFHQAVDTAVGWWRRADEAAATSRERFLEAARLRAEAERGKP